MIERLTNESRSVHGSASGLLEPAVNRAAIQILDYPGAQLSAVSGMKDLLDFAALQAGANGGEVIRAEICSTPKEGATAAILPPALSLAPPVLPAGWRENLIDLHKGGTVLASVCSGAFLLAETGLMEGRHITTHWRHAGTFRSRYPGILTDIDRLLVDLGDIVTAGGVMAWTDLTLHMIERFGGRKLMMDVAKMFVLDPPDREQRYYADFLPNLKHADTKILNVQHILQENIGAAHSITDLAHIACMSERSFLRRFRKATGLTPAAYLQRLRVEAARSRLELTKVSFERLSWDLGYADPGTFRSVFKRITGLSPSEYRLRFGAGTQASGL